jgi:hypothetical protein
MVVKSDHSPILLSNELGYDEESFTREKLFRYECMWESHEGLKGMLEEAWRSAEKCTSVQGLTRKLASVSRDLMTWGTNSFGLVRKEMRQLRRKLSDLRAVTTRVGPMDEEKAVELTLIDLCYREEVTSKQRSRIQWLSEGDSNTRIFHRKASARRSKNKIIMLARQDGSMTEDREELETMTNEFYSNLSAVEGTIGMEEVLSHILVKVTGSMNAKLNESYDKEEVRIAPFHMFRTKKMGPDGVPAHFF